MIRLFLLLFAISLFLVRCGLQYTPQTPPEDRQLQRQKVIEAKIKAEFEPQQKIYNSIAFGKTVTIKPDSFSLLDSLFEEKYKLEQTGRHDKNLDEKIGIQRHICQTDTNEILYTEPHVFSLQKDSIAEVFSGKFALNSHNEIRKVEFDESYVIPADLITLYGYYVLNESFLYNSENPTPEEVNFYTLYKGQAANLFGTQKENFIINTLKIMQIARSKRSLEKRTLLEELTKKAIHPKGDEFRNEVFVKMDEMSTTESKIDYYLVEYQFSPVNLGVIGAPQTFELKFDPYLQVISQQRK
jgi:hypothetical protein